MVGQRINAADLSAAAALVREIRMAPDAQFPAAVDGQGWAGRPGDSAPGHGSFRR